MQAICNNLHCFRGGLEVSAAHCRKHLQRIKVQRIRADALNQDVACARASDSTAGPHLYLGGTLADLAVMPIERDRKGSLPLKNCPATRQCATHANEIAGSKALRTTNASVSVAASPTMRGTWLPSVCPRTTAAGTESPSSAPCNEWGFDVLRTRSAASMNTYTAKIAPTLTSRRSKRLL